MQMRKQMTNSALAGGAHERTALWADRFAQRRRRAQDAAPTGEVTADAWVPGTIVALWALIDDAVQQANAALERARLTERIVTRRTSREYRLIMEGPSGVPRHIAVFVSLRAVAGYASGGAQVTTSETRATIYLVPSIDGGRLRWIVPRTGGEFTARVINDLLLSVFSDDPAATVRLSSYFSLNECI